KTTKSDSPKAAPKKAGKIQSETEVAKPEKTAVLTKTPASSGKISSAGVTDQAAKRTGRRGNR
ncbi:hypothetical protein HYS42_00210, partial [Candidatus Saccharibacteria bacterium]|nr:hypothetical protein [Candidatus Saccharibacteria bacterium]